MVTLDWSLERNGGVTLVGLVVAADRPCRVRVENRLDGPVWPPRRHGQPAAGWNDGAFTGTIPATGRLTVGYATPAPPAEPPAAVTRTGPATDADASADPAQSRPVPEVETTPAGVVRALGDPVVPRDSVPVADDGRAVSEGESKAGPEAGVEEGPGQRGADSDSERSDRVPDRAGEASGPAAVRPTDGSTPATRREAGRLVVPSVVRAWLRDVAARRDAVGCGRADAEGDPESAALTSAREADRRALRRVRRRADALLARDGGESPGEGRAAERETGTESGGER